LHLHTKGLVFDRGWKSPRTSQDNPTVWMGARRELSLRRNCDEENEPSSWDPRQPQLGGTAQAQLRGVYGNDFLELILIWKLLLGIDFNMKGIGYAYV